MVRRVAIYARYSTDLQRQASIDDQIRVCREYASRQGYVVSEVYSDAAMSGASMKRPGVEKLLADARNGQFDVIIAELLDRSIVSAAGGGSSRSRQRSERRYPGSCLPSRTPRA